MDFDAEHLTLRNLLAKDLLIAPNGDLTNQWRYETAGKRAKISANFDESKAII
ncbi:MAG: hypothetical protein LBR39_02485 [Coriobacteriales bacterium]|nr:hypothetical protein [Coriobacteriales bacterium]